jgi:hypothetical protein
VKRIAWETRGVEHRSVPADQRMAGATIPVATEAVQEKVSAPSAPMSAPKSAPNVTASSSELKPEEKKPAAPAPTASIGSVDRAAIARVVENVLAAQGIARGSGAPKSAPALAAAAAPHSAPQAKEVASPSSIAAEIAARFFGSSAKQKTEIADPSSVVSTPATKTAAAPALSAPTQGVAKKPEPSPKAAIEIQVFVSENDVRRAMTRSEKIFIGRKTILTPSARDLGVEHEVFVETEAGSIR